MSKLICPTCIAVHLDTHDETCPECKSTAPQVYQFRNSDEFLKRETPRVIEERKELGLEGLVGGLQSVIINTEPDRHRAAVAELLGTTGLEFMDTISDDARSFSVLRTPGSNNGADILVSSRLRKNESNPFREFNLFPKSRHLPDTRFETFVFETPDIQRYFDIQKKRGVRFLSDDIIHHDNYSFIQTIPSSFTGCSMGFIQWTGERGNYTTKGATAAAAPRIADIQKPDRPYLHNIRELDHTATRVRARDRDAAIIEFMELTNYHFDFAIYVKSFNSITNVARLSADDFAMVFTSGIAPYKNDATTGPTEKFIHNYGTRVHHMAFNTDNIEDTYAGLKADGQEFLLDLIGSPDDGLKQTFTDTSPNTLLVNEYIHRYGDFDGFFTKSNVTVLTGSTDKQ